MKLDQKKNQFISDKFQKMNSRYDLLNLINYTKNIVLEKKTKDFTINQLNFYADPKKSTHRYNSFVIKKKSGQDRIIHAPNISLKLILKCLNVIFQCVSQPHRSAFGFVNEKSIVDNARIHLNQNFVYNIDLSDFFYSFDRNIVKFHFMKKPYNLNGDKEKLAFFISCLCTHPIELNGENKIILPQGSPTSPTLTNSLCVTLDRRLNGLAKKMDAKFSRYADDITFSSNRNIFKEEDFLNELERIINSQSLVVNTNKTRLQTKFYRQEVTGLLVNKKVNVNRRYLKQIRMWLFFWEKYGYSKANLIFNRDYLIERGHLNIKKGNLSNVISGKLNFLKMVKGLDDSTYLKLHNRFKKLSNNLPDTVKE